MASLSAFNSADRNQLDAYVKRYDETAAVDKLLAFSSSTGGFTDFSVNSSAPDDVKVILKERSDGVISFADLRYYRHLPNGQSTRKSMIQGDILATTPLLWIR